MNLYHFHVSSGGSHLLHEEHVTRWLKHNIVDRIHFDLSKTLNATTDCVCWETPVTAGRRYWQLVTQKWMQMTMHCVI